MEENYISFNRDKARGLCLQAFEPHLDFFIREFETWLARQPKKVYLERPNRVTGLLLPASMPGTTSFSGMPVIVKRFGSRSVLHDLIGSMGPSKAIRSLRTAVCLQQTGVRTPRPLIAWQRGRWGGSSMSYYITEEIPDATVFRSLLQTPIPSDFNLSSNLTGLARLVRGMHDAGLFHRDLTLGNFLIGNRSDQKEPGIYIIDLSRAVWLGYVPLLVRFRDIARIKLQEHWPVFFEAYCKDRPDWKRWWPLLAFMIRLRRQKMALRKMLKTGRYSGI